MVTALVLAGAGGCTVSGDTSAPGPDPSVGREQLDGLTVAAADPMRGYDRDQFPHWGRTGENCDVRDAVLRRDGQDVVLDGCNVVDGRWFSPYDGRTVTDPSEMDIDHMVPLAAAWRSGAAAWTATQREEFANDLTRPQLIAVSRTTNRQKGDKDPSEWKPPDVGYWCRYAQDWITVKRYWKLSVTRSERDALAGMLRRC